jgi:pyruvate kinase
LEAIAEIANAADWVMAARGDLALNIPWVELPGAVSRIAEAARRAGKPWILATQIAEGVDRSTLPTRAEICDLAHWMQRGCRGVLLSFETAFGPRPRAAVKAATRLVRRWTT